MAKSKENTKTRLIRAIHSLTVSLLVQEGKSIKFAVLNIKPPSGYLLF